MDKGKELLEFCKSQNIKVVFYSTAMETLKTFSSECSKVFNMDISKVFKSITEERNSFYLEVPGVKPVIFVNDKMPREERIAAVEKELDTLMLSRLDSALSNRKRNKVAVA